MFYLRYELKPGPSSDEALGGAVANCWLKRTTMSEADTDARDFICSDGWLVVALECSLEVTADDYGNDSGAEHFAQADEDGECFVFHTWLARGEESSRHAS